MRTIHLIFEKQWIHAIGLAILLIGMVVASRYPGIREGQLWGINTSIWFWLAIGLAIVHQVYVWFCWRMQMHASLLTKIFGGNRAFTCYSIGFATIGLARTIAVFLLAFSNRDSIPLDTPLTKVLAVFMLVPALYTFYSVARYFSFRRAFGIDHFHKSYRTKPLERRGIFKFTRNGMYILGFLIFWVPAFWWASLAALSVAAFNHVYIWVHYFATELPDMKRIYGHSRLCDYNETS